MSRAYPLARTAKQALTPDGVGAATRYEAERLAGEVKILKLETEWLTLSDDDGEALMAAADAGRTSGFVQLYENADGSPVLAVTYWKLGKQTSKPKAQTAPAKRAAGKRSRAPKASGDHTDDLYFRRGRTKSRRKTPDPNQLDLFDPKEG